LMAASVTCASHRCSASSEREKGHEWATDEVDLVEKRERTMAMATLTTGSGVSTSHASSGRSPCAPPCPLGCRLNGGSNTVEDRDGELDMPPRVINGAWLGGGGVHLAAIFLPAGAHAAVFLPALAHDAVFVSTVALHARK
jgi:hypothetical protein